MIKLNRVETYEFKKVADYLRYANKRSTKYASLQVYEEFFRSQLQEDSKKKDDDMVEIIRRNGAMIQQLRDNMNDRFAEVKAYVTSRPDNAENDKTSREYYSVMRHLAISLATHRYFEINHKEVFDKADDNSFSIAKVHEVSNELMHAFRTLYRPEDENDPPENRQINRHSNDKKSLINKENGYLNSYAAYIAAFLLFVGIFDMPYGFYTFLRLTVFAVSAYFSYTWFKYEYSPRNFGISFILMAFLFNPFLPIHLSKGIWVAIDVFGAGFYGFIGFKAYEEAVNIQNHK
jgi:hypothetical protein